MIFEVEKAYSEDYKDILPLLNILNPKINNEKWAILIGAEWSCDEYIGFKAICEDKIVGIILTIFSTRAYQNEVIKFCNISSIVVHSEFRNMGIARSLWERINELKTDHIIIGFNPIDYTIKSYLTNGYNYYEDTASVIYYRPFNKIRFHATKYLNDFKEFPEYVKYYNDHRKYNLYPLLIIFDEKILFGLFEKKHYSTLVYRLLNKMLGILKINYRFYRTYFLPHYISKKIESDFECKAISKAIFAAYGITKLISPGYLFTCHKKKTISVGFSLLTYKPDLYKHIPVDTIYTEYFLLR